jgi:hypothetical protein
MNEWMSFWFAWFFFGFSFSRMNEWMYVSLFLVFMSLGLYIFSMMNEWMNEWMDGHLLEMQITPANDVMRESTKLSFTWDRYVHHIAHLKNQIKNPTKANQSKPSVHNNNNNNVSHHHHQHLGSLEVMAKMPKHFWLLKLVGNCSHSVDWWLDGRRMLTIKPQGKSKPKDCLFVCLFVCAVEGHLHL